MDRCRFRALSSLLEKPWLIGALVFFTAWPSFAQGTDTNLLSQLFFEQYFSIVLGMTLPVLLIFGLLKSITGTRMRYPIIFSAATLSYLYALKYLSEYQQPLILVSGATLVITLTFSTLIERLANKSQSIIAILSGAFYLAFIVLVLVTKTLGMPLIWLLFNGLNLVLVGALFILLHKKAQIKLLQESILWLTVVGFAIVNFLWLNTQISNSALVIAVITVYLVYVVNYCWRLSHQSLEDYQNENNLAIKTSGASSSTGGIDTITNLPNYSQALAHVKNSVIRENKRLAIVVFKPVNFAQVNRVLGHHNSDILLLQFAYTLQKAIAEDDLLVNFNPGNAPVKIARLHGLDFMVALDTSASSHPENVLIDQLCQKLKSSVPNAMSFKSFSLNFELVFGVAMTAQHSSVEQAISCAGDALLSGEQSDHHIHYYQQSSALYTEKRLRQMETLKQDIINGALTWNIRPQVSFTNNQLVGFEVVSNWRFQEQNRLSHREFIQIAEYSGEIYRLTCQLIEQACQLVTLLHQDNFSVQVSVNLSSKDVLEHDLVEFIEEIVEKYNTPIRYLVVEIDEHLVFEASDKAKRIIAQLKAIGAKVAINQFSGSYEALRYLRRMSIDHVKIDCSHLIGALEGSSSEKTIINALINLIRKMKLPLIATGIDNSEIKTTYTNIGGDIAQGDLIARDINIRDAEKWTSDWFLKSLQTDDD